MPDLSSHATVRNLLALRVLGGLLMLAITGGSVCAWMAWRFRVMPFPEFGHNALPVPYEEGGEVDLRMPNGVLVAWVGRYSDELTAFLRLQYLQSLQGLAGNPILMVAKEVIAGV